MKTVVVVGNPKPNSRTRDAAVRLSALLGGAYPEVIEVSELGTGLLGWGDATVKAAVKEVAGAHFAVFASPTFKATYSGLLKLFLDQFDTGEGLRGVTAVPLMLGAGATHALAPDLLLRPVLAELGATTPAPGLYQLDSTYTEDGTAEEYVRRWGPYLAAATHAGRAI